MTVDASPSTDTDGRVVEYLWDFGDGSVGRGPKVTHTFEQPGTYSVSLVVEDDRGGRGFLTSSEDVTIREPYAFGGFLQPVDPPPTMNVMQAGRAVPVRFGLSGNQGLDIFEPGFPQVHRMDCDTGLGLDEVEQTVEAEGSSLSYDSQSDTYKYTWKTSPVWAGSCRKLTVQFDDGYRYEAYFKFR